MKKKYFFGWANIKFVIKELVKILTGGKSYFSKKRIEGSIAFMTAIIGMVYFLYKNIETMTTSDIVLWATPLFLIGGYHLHQIQKEKKVSKQIEIEEG